MGGFDGGWRRVFVFFFWVFPLFSQDAIACDTRQGTRRLSFFPRMDGFGCFALLASRENTNLGGLERERGSCTIS
jgi:hypothetical protein